MHPDEIMTMPSDDALIFVKGHKPVKCKRLKYYEDDYFKNLVNIRTPSLYKVDLAKRDKQIERKVKLKPKPVEI